MSHRYLHCINDNCGRAECVDRRQYTHTNKVQAEVIGELKQKLRIATSALEICANPKNWKDPTKVASDGTGVVGSFSTFNNELKEQGFGGKRVLISYELITNEEADSLLDLHGTAWTEEGMSIKHAKAEREGNGEYTVKMGSDPMSGAPECKATTERAAEESAPVDP